MPYATNLKSVLSRHLLNLPGWRTHRKIVVIESDDWGSIRMPSREVYQKFLGQGIRVENDPYCRYDCLESTSDLEALFEVLTSVKDINGRHAVVTANTLVANPNFERIKAAGYSEYFYEPFTDTLQRIPQSANSFVLWKQGMQNGIFRPQFHGREHLYVKKWMKALQDGDPLTHLAFDFGTFGLTSEVDSRINGNFMGAFNSGNSEDIEEFKIIIEEGLAIFEKIFGYRSLSFIPTTYTWPPDLESILKDNGVRYLQGTVIQRIPIDDDTKFRYKKNNFLGTRSKAGLIYLMRNAYFEPAQCSKTDWVNDCLNRIKIAFFMKKPATISVHRLNFIGSIDESNRTRNLQLFRQLLEEIVKRYSDVEFMSSDELGAIIENGKYGPQN